MNLKLYNVAPCIPAELKFLETLANNVWWCWHTQAIELFIRINSFMWRELGGNAKAMLRLCGQKRLEELAHDSGYLRLLEQVKTDFEKDVVKNTITHEKRSVAYFSLEFGIHESIPIFSGGLGVLAGDHLKAASDQQAPLVAVGLLYRQGYFKQVLDRSGWQIEHYPVSEIHDLPLERACDPQGNEITISIRLIDRELFAAVWILWVGNIPLLLLDTELPQNPPDLREVTWRLYGGDKRMRLHQELLLGIGGYKALLALGCRPAACHMNEGHAGFMALARISDLVNNLHFDPNVALETVWRSDIFTTHTPVPAGNEVFDINLVRPYLQVFAQEAGLDVNRVIEWGVPINERGSSPREMSMTVFGLRLAANYSNGVSKLHGEVARNMWKHLWPERSISEIPIGSITNGVHPASWVSAPIGKLFDHYLPGDWMVHADKNIIEEALSHIPDEELWTAHEFCRQALVRRARRWVRKFRYQLDGNNGSAVTNTLLRPDILTVGFARRFATYKRGTLLLRDQERLLRLLRAKDRPIQFVFAGKAHPADNEGKQLIKDLVQFAQREKVQHKLVFLENYDIGMARTLVQGVDVWLNTPRRPQEASGTSGMKAAQNGAINCSILDGWWAEAWDGKNGWAISNDTYYAQNEDSDNYDSQQLFNLLENEIIPCFYDRSGNELPKRWIRMMKNSIATGLGDFSSNRMVAEYRKKYYAPAIEAYNRLVADDAAEAKRLVAEKNQLVENFRNNRIYVASPTVDTDLSHVHVGSEFEVSVRVYLGNLRPEQVEVDAYYGNVDAHNEIVSGNVVSLSKIQELGDGNYMYGGTIRCTAAGRFGLTARVKAAGIDWDNSVPGFMCWPKD